MEGRSSSAIDNDGKRRRANVKCRGTVVTVVYNEDYYFADTNYFITIPSENDRFPPSSEDTKIGRVSKNHADNSTKSTTYDQQSNSNGTCSVMDIEVSISVLFNDNNCKKNTKIHRFWEVMRKLR